MPAYEAKCSMRLEGDGPLDLHSALAHVSEIVDEHEDVLDAFFVQRDGREEVELLLEAEDATRAIELAESILDRIEESAARRFGGGAVTRSDVTVLADTLDPGDLLAEIEDAAAVGALDDPYGPPLEEAGMDGSSFDLDVL